MNFKPLGDRVVLKRSELSDKTSGGIYVTNEHDVRCEGTVVAVGEGRLLPDGKLLPLRLKQGDRVLFGKYNGTEFSIFEERYVVLREEDVVGLFTNKEEK